MTKKVFVVYGRYRTDADAQGELPEGVESEWCDSREEADEVLQDFALNDDFEEVWLDQEEYDFYDVPAE